MLTDTGEGRCLRQPWVPAYAGKAITGSKCLADTTSIVLLGAAQGGVVNNVKIASKIAHRFLQSPSGSVQLPETVALQLADRGDRGLVSRKKAPGSETPSGRDIEIRKEDAAVVMSKGGPAQILRDAATAEKFAAAILENAAGVAELRRQWPLAIDDQGETWRVRGKLNADRAVEGPGLFDLVVQKRDARVLDMKFE